MMKKSFGLVISLVALMYSGSALAATSASSLVEITGVATQDYFGNQTASCDINADGYDDLIIGSYNLLTGGTRNGGANIMYGSSTSLSSRSSSSLIRYTGEAEYDWAGTSVGCGDINADGYDDVFISAFYNSAGGIAYSGAVYLLYGQAATLTGGSLSTAIKFSGGAINEGIGLDVEVVGDLDGNGYNDVMIGAPFNDAVFANAGAVYLLPGKAALYTSSSLTTIATSLYGAAAQDRFGTKVSPAGDLNGDGFADAVIGATGVDSPGNDAGAVYVVYGSNQALSNATSASAFVRLTGEAVNDAVGYEVIGAGDVDGDGYDDLMVDSSAYGVTNTGAVYLIYGQSTHLTAGLVSQGVRFVGVAADDYLGTTIGPAGDTNRDGYADMLFSATYADTPVGGNGNVFLVLGQAARYTNNTITNVANQTYYGEATDDILGHGVRGVDFNGDGYSEVVMAAVNNGDAVALAGALYIAYLRYDLDRDSVLGAGGLLESGTDCNDTDGTVSTNQTYYLDTDGDGLGVADSSTTLCSSVPPTGYADNINDTNDTIVNNGVEIADDSIDNDGDGEVDEVNTVADNGGHPAYDAVDVLDDSAVAAALLSVRSNSQGQLLVTYADNSVYSYAVFNGTQTGKLKLTQYPETGYYAALQKSGKKVALINVLTGEKIIAPQRISKGKYTKHDLQFADLRSNGQQDLVIASSKGKRTRLFVTEVNLTKNRFTHRALLKVLLSHVNVQRTTVVGNTIDLRSNSAPLVSVLVTKQHRLLEQ